MQAHQNSATRDSVKWRGQDWGIDVAAVRLDDELFTDPMPVQFNNADMPALNVQPVEYESVFGEDGSFLRARSHVFKQGSTTDVTQVCWRHALLVGRFCQERCLTTLFVVSRVTFGTTCWTTEFPLGTNKISSSRMVEMDRHSSFVSSE